MAAFGFYNAILKDHCHERYQANHGRGARPERQGGRTGRSSPGPSARRYLRSRPACHGNFPRFQRNQAVDLAGHFLTTIFEIEVDGKKTRAIPRDYQLDPVRDFPIHVDFLRLSKGQVIKVVVPVHVVGQEKSPGVKRGGTINIVEHSIELLVPSDSIPDAVEASVADLDIGSSIHIADIKLPNGAKATSAENLTLVTCVAPSGMRKRKRLPRRLKQHLRLPRRRPDRPISWACSTSGGRPTEWLRRSDRKAGAFLMSVPRDAPFRRPRQSRPPLRQEPAQYRFHGGGCDCARSSRRALAQALSG